MRNEAYPQNNKNYTMQATHPTTATNTPERAKGVFPAPPVNVDRLGPVLEVPVPAEGVRCDTVLLLLMVLLPDALPSPDGELDPPAPLLPDALLPAVLPEVLPEGELEVPEVPEVPALPEVPPDVLPDVSPELPAEVSSEFLSELPPDVLPEVLPEVPPEALPGVLPEVFPEVLPEVLPGVLPDADAGFAPVAAGVLPLTTGVTEAYAPVEQGVVMVIVLASPYAPQEGHAMAVVVNPAGIEAGLRVSHGHCSVMV